VSGEIAPKQRMRAEMFVAIPFLLLPFAIYNFVEFVTPGATAGEFWTKMLFSLQMMSGASWTLSVGELLTAFSLLILFVELVKAARIAGRSVLGHLLSMLLFIGMLIEFLLVKQAATATFFLLLVISFVDAIGGYTVTMRASQRNILVDQIETTQRV
jgi:hypothetical protein